MVLLVLLLLLALLQLFLRCLAVLCLLLLLLLSDFASGADDAFSPGFGGPDSSGAVPPDTGAPAASPLSDSARAEVRRMYQYLVDLFPQSAGSSPVPLPPRALFEEFFASPHSPHQPVFLSWFEPVQSTLSDADARILSLLASGRHESTLLPPRLSQNSVGGGSASGSAVQVNPSLLAMFERPLRPSTHLGLTLREASLLESSSRALSEAQSHAMWLLSGLLGFVRLQGFSPSDSQLFNTLVSSLSKCLAHQAFVSASLTAFVSRGANFISLISLLTFRMLINALCWWLLLSVLTPSSWSQMLHACCLTLRRHPPSSPSRLWLMLLPTGLGLAAVDLARLVLLRLAVAVGTLAPLPVDPRGCVLILRLLLRL